MFSIPQELLPPPRLSWKKVFSRIPESQQAEIMDSFRDDELFNLTEDWFFTARREQFPPGGGWFIWLILAGRGFGKNWIGSNWIINEHRFGGATNSAVVARTASDLRRTCIEGSSGIMTIAPKDFYPEYKPSLSKLVWPNGTETQLYTADKPEKLRGPNHDRAWCDELSYWRYMEEAWDNLMMTLRFGTDPRCIITMTPRPIKMIKELLKRDGRDVVVTRGSTLDNNDNLSSKFIEQITEQYYGTRLWQQEVEGAYLEDMEGALWNRAMLEKNRVRIEPPRYSRKIVAVDPSTTGGEDADECGIIVAGMGRYDKHAYITADLSMRASPETWARRVVRAYNEEECDCVVAEKNNGGEMIRATIHSIDETVNVKLVHASRGKDIRAEPVASLDEQGRIHHVGMFSELEDEMCSFVPGDGIQESPNRMDARVWAIHELMISNRKRAGAWGRSAA